MSKQQILDAVEKMRIATTGAEVDFAERLILDAIDDAFTDQQPIEKDILRLRQKYAPHILAAILLHPTTNDAAMVARGVSLAHKLAIAVLTR